MSEEPDFEGTLIVEVITYTIYFGWLAILSAVALYIGIPPLPDIQDAFEPQWHGTAAAIASGTAFIAVSRFIYDAARKRVSPPPEPEPEPEPPVLEPEPEPEPEPPKPKKKPGKRRKKKR